MSEEMKDEMGTDMGENLPPGVRRCQSTTWENWPSAP